MAPMTECVASSISRWHGCKAEYYLLSCSTHSDVRWRDDRRRGHGVCFSEAVTYHLFAQAKNRSERLRIINTASPRIPFLRQEQDVSLNQYRKTIFFLVGGGSPIPQRLLSTALARGGGGAHYCCVLSIGLSMGGR